MAEVSSNGLGIFPPYKLILQDLESKITVIYNDISKWNLNGIHDINSFTSSLVNVRNQISKEINTLNNVHIPQATNTLNAAAAAQSASTVQSVVAFIRKLIAEIQAAVACFTLITKIITIVISIPILIATKIAELILHAVMMAEQAVLTYLKQIEQNILSYLNNIKQEMFNYIQALNGKSKVDEQCVKMQGDLQTISGLTLTDGTVLNKNNYNIAVSDYNIGITTLIIYNEQSIFGSYDVDSEVKSYFNTNISGLTVLKNI